MRKPLNEPTMSTFPVNVLRKPNEPYVVMTMRTALALTRSGLTNLDQLLLVCDEDLLSIPGIGEKAMDEIDLVLGQLFDAKNNFELLKQNCEHGIDCQHGI